MIVWQALCCWNTSLFFFLTVSVGSNPPEAGQIGDAFFLESDFQASLISGPEQVKASGE